MSHTYYNDVDAVGEELPAQAVRHALNTVLGGRVGSHERGAVLPADRSDVYHLTWAALKRQICSQKRQEGLGTIARITCSVEASQFDENVGPAPLMQQCNSHDAAD